MTAPLLSANPTIIGILLLGIGILLGGLAVATVAGHERRRLMKQVARLQFKVWSMAAVNRWPTPADTSRPRTPRSELRGAPQ